MNARDLMENHIAEVQEAFDADWELIIGEVREMMHPDVTPEMVQMLSEVCHTFYKRGWEQAYKKIVHQATLAGMFGDTPGSVN